MGLSPGARTVLLGHQSYSGATIGNRRFGPKLQGSGCDGGPCEYEFWDPPPLAPSWGGGSLPAISQGDRTRFDSRAPRRDSFSHATRFRKALAHPAHFSSAWTFTSRASFFRSHRHGARRSAGLLDRYLPMDA